MRNRKELLQEEGLLLLEFEEHFFQIKDKGKQEYIDLLVKKVCEEMECNCYSDVQLWPIIFDKIMKTEEMYVDMCRDIRTSVVSDFQKILQIFLIDGNFLAMDMAQEIMYNLQRLDKLQEFCLSDKEDLKEWDNEKLVEFIKIGKRKYSVYENDNGVAEISCNFLEDLDRYLENNTFNSDYFPHFFEIDYESTAEANRIGLDSNFLQLHILEIANEKYKEIVTGESNSVNISRILNDWVKKLSEATDEDLRYIWEKMTYYNSIIIYAKIFSEIFTEKETDKERERIIREFANSGLFSQTASMSNVLTKLLMLNLVLTEIKKAKNQNDKYEILMQLRDFLLVYNCNYTKMKRIIMEDAMRVRWHLGKKYKVYDNSRGRWYTELSRAYPMEIFESWILSSKIDDNWKYGELNKPNDKLKEFFTEKENSYKEYFLYAFYENRPLEMVRLLEKICVLSVIDQDEDTYRIVEKLEDMNLTYQAIIIDVLQNEKVIEDREKYYNNTINELLRGIRPPQEINVMFENHIVGKLYDKNLQCLLKCYYQKNMVSNLFTRRKCKAEDAESDT